MSKRLLVLLLSIFNLFGVLNAGRCKHRNCPKICFDSDPENGICPKCGTNDARNKNICVTKCAPKRHTAKHGQHLRRCTKYGRSYIEIDAYSNSCIIGGEKRSLCGPKCDHNNKCKTYEANNPLLPYQCHDGDVECPGCSAAGDNEMCMSDCMVNAATTFCEDTYGRVQVTKTEIGCDDGQERVECGPNVNYIAIQSDLYSNDCGRDLWEAKRNKYYWDRSTMNNMQAISNTLCTDMSATAENKPVPGPHIHCVLDCQQNDCSDISSNDQICESTYGRKIWKPEVPADSNSQYTTDFFWKLRQGQDDSISYTYQIICYDQASVIDIDYDAQCPKKYDQVGYTMQLQESAPQQKLTSSVQQTEDSSHKSGSEKDGKFVEIDKKNLKGGTFKTNSGLAVNFVSKTGYDNVVKYDYTHPDHQAHQNTGYNNGLFSDYLLLMFSSTFIIIFIGCCCCLCGCVVVSGSIYVYRGKGGSATGNLFSV